MLVKTERDGFGTHISLMAHIGCSEPDCFQLRLWFQPVIGLWTVQTGFRLLFYQSAAVRSGIVVCAF
jgi:hypothetical protein